MNRDQFDRKRAEYLTHRVAGIDDAQASGDSATSQQRPGRRPLQVVTLGSRGLSVLVDGLPVFLAFRDHPELARAPGDELRVVHRQPHDRLNWPTLGVSIAIGDLRRSAA